jgi:magnesium transporter
MINEIFKNDQLEWVDGYNLNASDIEILEKKYQLDPLWLRESISPQHSPKYLALDEWNLIILRWLLPESKAECTNMRELTQKLVIFVKNNLFITIHRRPLNILETLSKKLNGISQAHILIQLLLEENLKSYESQLTNWENELEQLDKKLFQHIQFKKNSIIAVQKKWQQLSTFKKLLWHTSTLISQLPADNKHTKSMFRALHERFRDLQNFADDLGEEAHSLANIGFSLANQKNNDVIRVLTIFSAFFLPLTFIVGVYGMNFKHMPEIEWLYGYPSVWIVLISLTGMIALWFYKKGWLKN